MRTKITFSLLKLLSFLYLIAFIFDNGVSYCQESDIFYDSGIQLGQVGYVGIPRSLDVADVNNDGLLDIGVGVHVMHDLIYLNNGDNTFEWKCCYGGWGNPFEANFADMDNDGDLDFLTGYSNGLYNGPITISVNDGTGEFPTKIYLSPPQWPPEAYSYSIGDFNGDDLLDIVMSKCIFINEGNLNFSNLTFPLGADYAPHAEDIGDVDDDGDLDLAFADDIWINDGNGNFARANLNLQVRTNGHNLKDINQDGYLDLIVSNYFYNYINIYNNDGNGNFIHQQIIYCEQINYIFNCVVEDFNKDGWMDLVVAGSTGIEVFLNDCNGSFYGPVQIINYYATDIVGADMNDDGYLDIIFTEYILYGRGKPYIWYNKLGLNSNPISDAGEDQTIECTSNLGTEVILNGSNSSDPDNDPLTYIWLKNTAVIAGPTTNPISHVNLDEGTHLIELQIEDGRGGVDNDEVVINIIDTRPPQITLSVEPNILWPPNHKMIDIVASVVIDDICDNNPTYVLKSILSNELDESIGDGNTLYDIQDAEFGEIDTVFSLRAERSGKGEGRIYRVIYEAIDAAGKITIVEDSVTVPHSNDKFKNTEFYNSTYESNNISVLSIKPNPFSTRTVINYQLSAINDVELTVYNLLEQKVTTLVKERQQPGSYEIEWDASGMKPGIYWCELKTGQSRKVIKMILLRE